VKHTFLTISTCLAGLILAFPPIMSAIELPPEEVYAGHKLIDDWNTEAAEHSQIPCLKNTLNQGTPIFSKHAWSF